MDIHIYLHVYEYIYVYTHLPVDLLVCVHFDVRKIVLGKYENVNPVSQCICHAHNCKYVDCVRMHVCVCVRLINECNHATDRRMNSYPTVCSKPLTNICSYRWLLGGGAVGQAKACWFVCLPVRMSICLPICLSDCSTLGKSVKCSARHFTTQQSANVHILYLCLHTYVQTYTNTYMVYVIVLTQAAASVDNQKLLPYCMPFVVFRMRKSYFLLLVVFL